VIGSAIYLQLVVSQLRADGLLSWFRAGRFQTPGREIVRFSVPILVHDLVLAGISTLGVVVIGRTHGTEEVASFRAAFPVARINHVVGWTFVVLYMPLAARTFARGDVPGMRHAYWRSAAWLTVLTLPLFLLTGPFAGSLTSTLFGDEYRDAAPILALLASGFYLNMSLGFNTLTLQTFGRLKFTFAVDVGTMAAFWIIALWTIPTHGARGAAAATAISLVVLNLGAQVGVWRMGLTFFDRTYASVYISVAAAIGACWAVGSAIDPPLPIAVVVVAVVSLVVLWGARHRLDVIGTFPELARIPILKSMFR
jgi:O-antigen/teichoic acid export membrane protein